MKSLSWKFAGNTLFMGAVFWLVAESDIFDPLRVSNSADRELLPRCVDHAEMVVNTVKRKYPYRYITIDGGDYKLTDRQYNVIVDNTGGEYCFNILDYYSQWDTERNLVYNFEHKDIEVIRHFNLREAYVIWGEDYSKKYYNNSNGDALIEVDLAQGEQLHGSEYYNNGDIKALNIDRADGKTWLYRYDQNSDEWTVEVAGVKKALLQIEGQ
ncbi:hypothetical protein EDC56_0595 [Sinobacterium caligoides]|uniref:Uncharacterized protein n=1 Tax=Sinobacterium caligoides TaxID=933926 RepID=A0A3N2DYZ4_9GAMM|nr:hypothetical protein [Sinobacterium caligoides]ROS05073.1 hypothetical protein EDC56_0595 [Sinobacterium caligoides]